jgi:hypothetical protein
MPADQIRILLVIEKISFARPITDWPINAGEIMNQPIQRTSGDRLQIDAIEIVGHDVRENASITSSELFRPGAPSADGLGTW